jgi:hypothetical protein
VEYIDGVSSIEEEEEEETEDGSNGKTREALLKGKYQYS